MELNKLTEVFLPFFLIPPLSQIFCAKSIISTGPRVLMLNKWIVFPEIERGGEPLWKNLSLK